MLRELQSLDKVYFYLEECEVCYCGLVEYFHMQQKSFLEFLKRLEDLGHIEIEPLPQEILEMAQVRVSTHRVQFTESGLKAIEIVRANRRANSKLRWEQTLARIEKFVTPDPNLQWLQLGL